MTTSGKQERSGGGLAGVLGLGDGEHARDQLTILAGTGQNIVGLAVFMIATFAMNIMVAHAFGKHSAAFGYVTLVTQLAFVAGAATRFGMDMAAVRRVAVEVGKGEAGRARAVVRIAVTIALAVSIAVAIVAFALAAPIARSLGNVPTTAMRAAAVTLVFVALAQVYLGGSRGLKIMRHTLYAYWVGQSISWIVLTLIGWALLEKSVAVTVLAYAASWVVATAIAFVSWRSATASFAQMPAEPGETAALVKYGAPRAPAALLSQAVFYTDLAVLSNHFPDDPRLSAYAAAIRVAQALVLFLTAVSYMFSPFVADLHERSEHDRLNALFKQITRWTLAGTIPLLLLFAIAPSPVLHVFGADYTAGSSWLRVLLIGQIVNVSVGAAGFILIMVGRTGWDLAVYASSFLLDLIIAIVLVPHAGALGGPMGAATAQATALVFSNSLRLYLVWRFVRIQPYDRNYARLAIPAVIGAVAMLAVHALLSGPKWGLDLVGTALIGGVVYYTSFLLFGLTPNEKGTVMRVLLKARA
ncbi:MAG: MATE family efflux transporter [Actinomycetota bacterium]|nr:MATE family efflux transporter [Actinomycetota bacterium]